MTNFDNSLTREKLMQQIESSWNELQTYLSSLTEEQLTRPTDTAGWTVKDHLIHLAVWVNAGLEMLERKSKRIILDINPEIWEQGEDPINAVLYERYQKIPLNEAIQALQQNHEKFLKKVNIMTEGDLQLPHSHYQPDSTEKRPIIDFIFWDTAEHYREHIPWIQAIVEND